MLVAVPMPDAPTIHASCVLTGAKAVLIRGPSGAGKSWLALELLQAADRNVLPFARLVADDRVHVEAVSGRLLARPAESLAGLLEIRGLGLRRLPFEPVAAVGLVVDLAATAERLPAEKALETVISGITLPRLAFPVAASPLPAVLAATLALPRHSSHI